MYASFDRSSPLARFKFAKQLAANSLVACIFLRKREFAGINSLARFLRNGANVAQILSLTLLCINFARR